MACVVFLRGVNVGGHRTFRPAALAERLGHLGVVNIGAAGTLVIRRPVGRARLRAEIAGHLPFQTEIIVCDGREILRLVSLGIFAGTARRDIVPFVSVLPRVPRSGPKLPIQLPSQGPWLLRILGRDGRFVYGVYRRQMKAIGYLGKLDRLFEAPVTTRNWNSIMAIARVLEE